MFCDGPSTGPFFFIPSVFILLYCVIRYGPISCFSSDCEYQMDGHVLFFRKYVREERGASGIPRFQKKEPYPQILLPFKYRSADILEGALL